MTKIDTRALCKMALCAAILCVASYISFPLPFTPVIVSGQTLAVNLLALILSPAQAGATVAVYILLGLIGLPVFAGGGSGIGSLIGPYSGYIYGFLAAAVLISLLKGQKPNLVRWLTVTIGVGIPVIDLGGMASLMLVNKMTVGGAFLAGAVPFFIGDIFKCVVACLAAVALEKAMKRVPAAG
jgi:biotin transport system substrate-specific component